MHKKPFFIGYVVLSFLAVAVLVNVVWTQRIEINRYQSQVTVLQQKVIKREGPAPTPDPQTLEDLSSGLSRAIGG